MELLAPHSFFSWGQRGKTSHTGGGKWIWSPALPDWTRFVYLPRLQGFALGVIREDTLENGNCGPSPGKFSLVLFTVVKKTRGLNEFQSPGPFRTNSMPPVPPHHPSLSYKRTTLVKNTNCDKVERNLCHQCWFDCNYPLKSYLFCVFNVLETDSTIKGLIWGRKTHFKPSSTGPMTLISFRWPQKWSEKKQMSREKAPELCIACAPLQLKLDLKFRLCNNMALSPFIKATSSWRSWVCYCSQLTQFSPFSWNPSHSFAL